MFTVMIVDDEPLICKGISAMIPWEELGAESAGLAENGAEALERIRKVKSRYYYYRYSDACYGWAGIDRGLQ